MKRFTDTELWKKPWYMELTPSEKLAFFYIKDQCDNVGVWTPNFRLAEFIIGMQLDWDKFADKCHGNIKVLENGKWWIIDYCRFQHPDLVNNPDGGNSKALKSYVKLLREHCLYDSFLSMINGHSMGIEGAYPCPQGTGKGKGKGTGKEEAQKYQIHPFVTSYYRTLNQTGKMIGPRLPEDNKRAYDLAARDISQDLFEKTVAAYFDDNNKVFPQYDEKHKRFSRSFGNFCANFDTISDQVKPEKKKAACPHCGSTDMFGPTCRTCGKHAEQEV